MAKKSKLTQVAVKIGAAMGRADRKAPPSVSERR